MPYFVDQSGRLLEADAGEAEALKAQGLREASRDDLIKHNEGVEYEEKSLLGKAGDVAVGGLQGIARASMAPGMALQYALTGDPKALESGQASPEVRARWSSPGADFEESVFSPEAQARKERHPLTAGVAEAAPSMVAGGALGALAVPAAGSIGLLPAAGGLLAESGLSGISQEAVDSVTQKRDFSAKAALMNGGIDLAFSAATFGLGYGGGRLLNRGATEVGTEAAESGVRAATGAEPGMPSRNWVAELDPGEAPEAIGAARRARSAGAAAAANAPYPGGARAAAEGAEAAPGAYKGRGANDAEPFTDDMWEGANKAWKKGEATASPEDAKFLADPVNREKLTELGAANVADNLDTARKILRDDASIAAKNADIHKFAQEWTPEQVAAQGKWVDETAIEAERLIAHIDDSRRAAADVRAGKAGPRAGGAEAIDAGGVDTAFQKTLRNGLDRVRRAEGAERAIAIDGFKRELGKLDGMISRSGSLDQGTKAARKDLVSGFYATLQQGLQDPAKFGRLGDLQKSTNEAVTRLIEPFRRIEDQFSTRLDDTFGEVGQKAINRETKAAAVAQMLRAGPLERREFIRALDDGLAAADDLMTARQQFGITSLDDLEVAKRGLEEIRNDFRFSEVLGVAEAKAGQIRPGFGEMARDAAINAVAGRVPVLGGAAGKMGKEFLERFGKSAELPKTGPLAQVLDNRLKAYSRNMDLRSAGVSQRLPDWLQDALRGHGGQVAGVAGLVGAGALLAPGQAGAAELLPDQQKARDGFQSQLSVMPPDQQQRAIATAESFARIQAKTEQRVQGAVADLFSLAKDPNAQPKYRSPEARQIDKRAAELDVPRHMARFMGKHDDPTQAFRDKSKVIQQIVSDPAALSRRMAANLGDLPTEQPEIFASMVGQTMAVAEYLHERRPGNAGRSALDPGGYPPTFEEISEWAGHWVGAVHALDTLDDLASNDLVPEQMEAVQALHPEAYVMFQTTAMKQIHELSRKRGAIPLEALEQIDSALGLDGAGEPILSSAMADLIGQATAKEAERLKAQAQAQQPQGPMVSQSPSRLASSSLASLHPE